MMEIKIQALTDKLFREGVEKGEAEAARILEEARQKREEILNNARQEAENIVNKAGKTAQETKKNTEAELRLYASQAVETLKSHIANLVTGKLAATAVKSAFDDPEFMRKVILEIVAKWSPNESLVIATPEAGKLRDYFAIQAKDLLDKGLKIEQVNGHPSHFTIAPGDGSYKINFGEEEFAEYFKEFLRPQLVDLLFD